MMNRAIALIFSIFCLLPASTVAGATAQEGSNPPTRDEEAHDYYKKWLKEDVVYIITDEERKVFENLTTAEEREQFIEQFWFRRDPNPLTAPNEFKEEHYRRIAYTNEHFSSGIPGWMSDRGRIYIIHGPPAEIESHPTGGNYQRPSYEGGGSTSTFPFEVWRYRHIEGIGSDIEIEFVDPTMTGEYRIALNPEEKDALLHVPGAGLTLAEQLGLANKADRPYFSGGARDRYPLMTPRRKDNPFERYLTYSQVQAAPPVKYHDLKELVKVDVAYDNLPFELHADYFRLNEDQVLVPLTLQFDNKDLNFESEGDLRVARLAIYGLVTSITNRVIAEFEDDLATSYNSAELSKGLQKSSVYQKVIAMDTRMRHKIDLVVKDLNSGNVGLVRQAIVPPPFKDAEIHLSSLVLADLIRPLGDVPDANEMFVLGDVKVRPSLGGTFSRGDTMGVYLQAYNIRLDQSSISPSLRIVYTILKDGEVAQEVVDESGESIQFFSGQRVVLIRQFDTASLPAGNYRMQVKVEDLLSRQSASVQADFKIVEHQPHLSGQ